jgi:hypothetical protein
MFYFMEGMTHSLSINDGFDIYISSTEHSNDAYRQNIKSGASNNFSNHFGGSVGEKANFHR